MELYNYNEPLFEEINSMITSCMTMLNTTVKNATSNVTRVVTIDIIYRIIGILTDKSIIYNVCRTNPVIIIMKTIQCTIRICLSGGFCPGGFVQRGLCPGGVCPGCFVQGVLSWGVLSRGVLSGGILVIIYNP